MQRVLIGQEDECKQELLSLFIFLGKSLKKSKSKSNKDPNKPK